MSPNSGTSRPPRRRVTAETSKVFPGLSYWAIWNEPNLLRYLSPQMSGNPVASALNYRAMLNASAAAIHKVSSSNVVIAGETSPFGGPPAHESGR